MNDIEKMRKEFNEKIRLAELENECNERLEPNGVTLRILYKDNEGRYHVSIRKLHEKLTDKFDGHDAQTVLRLLPRTDDINVYVGDNKYLMLPYHMETNRSPRDTWTTLAVKYVHNDMVVSFDLPLNERNHELMQYFTRTQRELDGATIGLYYGAVTPKERARLQMLPFLTFNCGRVVRFYGGHHRQVSAGHLDCIASSIENDDFSWERE